MDGTGVGCGQAGTAMGAAESTEASPASEYQQDPFGSIARCCECFPTEGVEIGSSDGPHTEINFPPSRRRTGNKNSELMARARILEASAPNPPARTRARAPGPSHSAGKETEAQVEPVERVEMQGVVQKRGSWVGQWHVRFLKLSGSTCNFFDSEVDPEHHHPKGDVAVHLCSATPVNHPADSKHPGATLEGHYEWHVTVEGHGLGIGHQILFASPSESECDKWIESFNRARAVLDATVAQEKVSGLLFRKGAMVHGQQWTKHLFVVINALPPKLNIYPDAATFHAHPDHPEASHRLVHATIQRSSVSEDLRTGRRPGIIFDEKADAGRSKSVHFTMSDVGERERWYALLCEMAGQDNRAANDTSLSESDGLVFEKEMHVFGFHSYTGDRTHPPFQESKCKEMNITPRSKYLVMEMRLDGWCLLQDLSSHYSGKEPGWAPGNYLTKDGRKPWVTADTVKTVMAEIQGAKEGDVLAPAHSHAGGVHAGHHAKAQNHRNVHIHSRGLM